MPNPPREPASVALPAARRPPAAPGALRATALHPRPRRPLPPQPGKVARRRARPEQARNPILLLETTGRTSGKTRTTPLIFLADGRDFVVVASGRGPNGTPDWLRNLDAAPLARVKPRDEVVVVRAERPNPAERARLWPRLVAMFARWGDTQALTDRDVPVLILRPVAPAAPSTV